VSQSFLCPRGRAAIEYHQHPKWLRHPLKWSIPRGSGEWVHVGWDHALDEIAERLLRIADESGPEALAYLCGTFHGANAIFGHLLMHHFESPSSDGIGVICGGPRYAAEALMFGSLPSAPDYAPGVTRTIVLWARHPAASNPLLWRQILRTRDTGAALIVVDVRPTSETRAAGRWLQPRPGTDVALALGLLHVVFAEGLLDQAVAATQVSGPDALRERCAAYPPERVAAITGVSTNDIRAVARACATDGPAVVSTGAPNGSGLHALGFEMAVSALVALTSNLDRPGAIRLPGESLLGSKISGEEYAALPPERRRKRLGTDRFRLHEAGFEMISTAARRIRPETAYPYSVQFWGAAHSPAVFRAIADGEPYQVRSLLVQHNNLLGSYTNGARY
jgi:anaerobic selenocysteine-containing dehydrogenase